MRPANSQAHNPLEEWVLQLASSWGDRLTDSNASLSVLSDTRPLFLDCLRRSLGVASATFEPATEVQSFADLARALAALWNPEQVEMSWSRAIAECLAEAAQSDLGAPVGAFVLEVPFAADWPWEDWTVVASLYTYDRVEDFRSKLQDAIEIYSMPAMFKYEMILPGLLIDATAFRRALHDLASQLDQLGVARKKTLFAAIGVDDGGFDHVLTFE